MEEAIRAYHPKTTRRNFGMVNNALRQRLSYGRRRRKFTGKELDAETGLYYYGARYLDPKTSRWLSGDPAMGEYFPSAPVNDEAKKRNGNLPGQGGVFNYVNLHAYHYAGNNPVKYIDPDGREASKERHLERNKNQYGYAPPSKGVMDRMVEMGLFEKWGNTSTHNLKKITISTPKKFPFSITISVPVVESNGTNIDYRGAVGTIFEGMQFVYDSNGNLVIGSLNKGTFDFNSPIKNKFMHGITDFLPWLIWGNGSGDALGEVLMNDEQWSKIEAIYSKYKAGIIKSKEQAAQEVQRVFLPPPESNIEE